MSEPIHDSPLGDDRHEPIVPENEADESTAPRPEEEIPDPLRAEPDVADRSEHHSRG